MLRAGDPEVLPDPGRRQRVHVDEQVPGPRRVRLDQVEQPLHVPVLLGGPGRAGDLVRHALHEQRRGVVAGGVGQRRVQRRVQVPLQRRRGRQPAGRRVVEGHPQRGQHAAVHRRRQQVHGRPVLAAPRVRQRGEPRQPGQREVDLHRLPGRAPRVAVDALPQRAGRRRPSSPAAGTGRWPPAPTRGGTDPRRGRVDAGRPRRRAVSIAGHLAAGPDLRAGLHRQLRQPARHRAHAAAARPSRCRPRRAAGTCCAPGSCARSPGDHGEPVRPGMPSVTAYMDTTVSEANPNRPR